jgi:hypothetical protein
MANPTLPPNELLHCKAQHSHPGCPQSPESDLTSSAPPSSSSSISPTKHSPSVPYACSETESSSASAIRPWKQLQHASDPSPWKQHQTHPRIIRFKVQKRQCKASQPKGALAHLSTIGSLRNLLIRCVSSERQGQPLSHTTEYGEQSGLWLCTICVHGAR